MVFEFINGTNFNFLSRFCGKLGSNSWRYADSIARMSSYPCTYLTNGRLSTNCCFLYSLVAVLLG